MTETQMGFHAAISMANRQDSFTLTRYLLNLLHAQDCVERAMLHEVGLDPSEHTSEPVPPVFRRFIDDPAYRSSDEDIRGLQRCLNERVPIVQVLSVGRVRLVFYVQGLLGPDRLVSVEGRSFSPHDRVCLRNLITFYEHEIQLLDAKERDALTGLLNRHSFNLRLNQVLARMRHATNHAWLASFDIDHFKRVNDNHGHLSGDEILLHLAQLMKRSFRYTDYLFCFGGEEFLAIYTDTTPIGIYQALERFRVEVEHYNFPGADSITVSIGYTCIELADPGALLERADKGLRQAKQSGRNRVVSYESLA